MKTVIVGGGVAGLTAGIYCQSNGIDCEILEKNAFCGGNLTGWKRDGCYIDNCIHWLTGTLPGTDLYKIWRDIGMITDRGSLYQPNVFYESVLNGKSIAFSRYPEVTRLNMLRISPMDALEIDRFIDSVEAVAALIEKRTPSKDIVTAYARYRGISLAQLSGKFRHPLLKRAFTDYFGEYFSAIALVWAYGVFVCGNGMIPKGGSQKAAERIESKFVSLGGRIRRSCTVDRLVTDGERAYGVLTENGEYIRADAVICACDPAVIFGRLTSSKKMPRGFVGIYKNPKLAPRFSSVQAAFCCRYSDLPRFGTRVISCPMVSGVERIVIKEYGHESDFAPDGSAVIQAMLFINGEQSEKWIRLHSDSDKYRAEKEYYSEAMMLAIVSEFPQLKNNIKRIDAWTPATYHNYFGADHGAYMAFALTPKTPLRRYSCRLNGLENVFLATQWQCSPGGLPNAARSGKIAAEAVKKIFK